MWLFFKEIFVKERGWFWFLIKSEIFLDFEKGLYKKRSRRNQKSLSEVYLWKLKSSRRKVFMIIKSHRDLQKMKNLDLKKPPLYQKVCRPQSSKMMTIKITQSWLCITAHLYSELRSEILVFTTTLSKNHQNPLIITDTMKNHNQDQILSLSVLWLGHILSSRWSARTIKPIIQAPCLLIFALINFSIASLKPPHP